MSTSATHRPLAALLLAVGITSLLAGFGPEARADTAQRRRLQISIDFVRDAAERRGGDQLNSRLEQQWTLSAWLDSDGVPAPNNPLDPDDSRRLLERAQRQQARVQAALARRGKAAVAAGDDDAAETPYLHFNGAAACAFDSATRIDERVEGQFQDVQGTVPFTQTTHADQRLRDEGLCPFVQAVLDTRSGRWWTQLSLALQPAPGRVERREQGRPPRRSEGPVSLRWLEADAWLQQRLLALDAQGRDAVRLAVAPPPGGHAAPGRVELRLQWRFDKP